MARYQKVGRMYRILEMLKGTRYGKTIDEIADELECSTRTVRRYLEAMQCDALYPIYSERRGERVVWKILDEGRVSSVIPIDKDELIAVVMAQQILASKTEYAYLAQALDSLVLKLKAQRSQEFAKLVDQTEGSFLKPSLSDNQPDQEPAFVQDVLQAISSHRKIRFDHTKWDGEITPDRLVAPLAVRVYNGSLYLISYCFMRQDIRQFALRRMENVVVTDEVFEEDYSYDDQSYFGAYAAKPEEVLLRVDPCMIFDLTRHPIHPSQEIYKDGCCYYMRLHVGVNWGLMQWILGYGPGVQVIKPDHFKEFTLNYLKHAVEAYGE